MTDTWFLTDGWNYLVGFLVGVFLFRAACYVARLGKLTYWGIKFVLQRSIYFFQRPEKDLFADWLRCSGWEINPDTGRTREGIPREALQDIFDDGWTISRDEDGTVVFNRTSPMDLESSQNFMQMMEEALRARGMDVTQQTVHDRTRIVFRSGLPIAAGDSAPDPLAHHPPMPPNEGTSGARLTPAPGFIPQSRAETRRPGRGRSRLIDGVIRNVGDHWVTADGIMWTLTPNGVDQVPRPDPDRMGFTAEGWDQLMRESPAPMRPRRGRRAVNLSGNDEARENTQEGDTRREGEETERPPRDTGFWRP